MASGCRLHLTCTSNIRCSFFGDDRCRAIDIALRQCEREVRTAIECEHGGSATRNRPAYRRMRGPAVEVDRTYR